MTQDKLDSIKRIGRLVARRKKGDFSSRPAVERLGEVEDEVRAREGDNLYILERIRTGNTVVLYRLLYYTMESRVRPGHGELRVGFGQYAPILSQSTLQELVGQARTKGWVT